MPPTPRPRPNPPTPSSSSSPATARPAPAEHADQEQDNQRHTSGSSAPTSNSEVWRRISRDLAGAFIGAAVEAARVQFGFDGPTLADLLRNLADETENPPE